MESAEKSNEITNSPDVAEASLPAIAGNLEWVGMEKIASPVKIGLADGSTQVTPAMVDVGVSLESDSARGIHMSRIFTLVQERLGKDVLSLKSLKALLDDVIESQKGLGHSGRMEVRYSLPVLKSALLSEAKGWQIYPVTLSLENIDLGTRAKLAVEVLYSSTCPCSAALASQLMVERFREDFVGRASLSSGEVAAWLEKTGFVATPHAQRSLAKVEVELQSVEFSPRPEELIEVIEKALGTPVQTAVKRVDEQEFARLNATHQMFCEDAARRLKAALNEDGRFLDFRIEVEHQESLHAHNAVARARK